METPLPDPWAFYLHRRSHDYRSSILATIPVRTCEEWARVYNHAPGGREFASGATVQVKNTTSVVTTLSFFREGVHPEWEDPANRGGTTLSARNALSPQRIDEAWKVLLCECARNALDPKVQGVQLSQRWMRGPVVKIDVWVGPGSSAATATMLRTLLPDLSFAVAARR